MTRDMRILGGMQGLLLGLVLAAPLISSSWMAWGVQILFALSAFQLRLADRRWALRPGWQGWISHIRMAPARMLPWAASAVVSVIADADGAATPAAILIATAACELLLYPLLTHMTGGWQRRRIAIALVALIAAGAGMPAGAGQNIALFLLGALGCTFWLRGPDGDLRSALAALGGGISAAILAIAMPATLPLAFPLAVVSLLVACAQMSTLRRQLSPWTADHAVGAGWLRRIRARS